jgi:hypothetical protein
VKSGYAHEEDASTVSRQIKNRVLQLKQAREVQLQADASRLMRVQSIALQNTDSLVQTVTPGDHVNGSSGKTNRFLVINIVTEISWSYG